MSETINTEKPLSYDYFDQEENEDTSLMKSILSEYQQVGGLSIDYYCQQDPDMGMSTIFLEKEDKKWVKPIRIKAVFEYLQEVIENQRYGINILDELNIITEKTYFVENIKRSPKIGDLVKINHINLFFEIVNVVDSEANFFGQKLTWKITGKIWQEAHESEEISNDAIEAGWRPDEPDKDAVDINKKIDTEQEPLHTYKTGQSPFGDF